VPAEVHLLQAIRALAGPGLDRFFLLSHYLGTLWLCLLLVLVMVLFHLLRHERREANVWLAVGLSTYVLQEGLKRLCERLRPELWPRLYTWPPPPAPETFSFPSGHALASATLYPLLAYVLTRERPPKVRRAALALGVLAALWIGFGRLYLGVHWPSDVLAGWLLGAVQAAYAIRALARARPLADSSVR
jgi:undecaprenyl-diphosphatase